MPVKLALVAFFLLCAASFGDSQKASKIPNPSINMKSYLRLANEAAKHREKRRLTEEEFIEMSQQPGVVVLDARSKGKYDELHIKDAINLSFPDITVESMARVLPDKGATILIYCNNNFRNAEAAFPAKMPAASRNLSTYIALYTYGYRNVYELGPLLDVETTKLDLVASPNGAND